jgi:hypothetical protein
VLQQRSQTCLVPNTSAAWNRPRHKQPMSLECWCGRFRRLPVHPTHGEKCRNSRPPQLLALPYLGTLVSRRVLAPAHSLLDPASQAEPLDSDTAREKPARQTTTQTFRTATRNIAFPAALSRPLPVVCAPAAPVDLARLSMAQAVGRAARVWTRCFDPHGARDHPQATVILSSSINPHRWIRS